MLGICHELLGEKKRAEDIYKLVINNKSFREDQKLAFFYHLGNMYASQDSYAEAVEQYKRVIKIDREFADVKEKIKLVNKKMSGEKVEEEISVHIGDALSEEGADLWDSVLGGGEGQKEGKEGGEEEDSSKKQKGKISYI
jgi:tetratricopeptide (TPR) repeat protein